MSTGSVDAVILAAGEARRARGAFKLGWPIGGVPLLVRTVQAFQPVADRVIVVTGHRPDRVRNLLRQVPGVVLVHNDRYRTGMFSSVQAGLAAADGERIFLTPGDIAAVRTEVLQALLAADGPVCVPSFQGRTGHPVLFTRTVREAVLDAAPNTTLRDVLRTFPRTVVPVSCEGILMDIDSVSDYNEIQERYEQTDF